MRTTALGLILALSAGVHAQCPPKSTLFFANGMFNSEEDADRSLKDLAARIPETENWSHERAYLAYNGGRGPLYQLLEVFEQKTGEFDKRFWRWMWDWSAAPDWFQHSIASLLSVGDLAGLQGYDLSDHILRYEDEMDKQRSIVVVAHSQGNFFANNASLLLQNEFYPASTKFRIVAVATPAAYVNDDGPYFTLQSDGVIRAVPESLPANSVNVLPVPGRLDHRFVDHYLNGEPTGRKIINAVTSTLAHLSAQARADEGYNADCWRWFESLNLLREDSDACELKCAAAKNDFSNFTCGTLCAAFCRCR